MTFTVSKTSDWGYTEEVEITTLEELRDFQEKHETNVSGSHYSLIINFDTKTIEIYDDYRE